MGMVNNISYDKYPIQKHIGERVQVCFGYDTSKTYDATVVRSDCESPYITIFKLDNGRYLLSTECMFRYLSDEINKEDLGDDCSSHSE